MGSDALRKSTLHFVVATDSWDGTTLFIIDLHTGLVRDIIQKNPTVEIDLLLAFKKMKMSSEKTECKIDCNPPSE